MFRNLKPSHPQRQLELLYLASPCAHSTIPRPGITCRPTFDFLQTRSATTARPLRTRHAKLTEDNEQSNLPRHLRRAAYSPSSVSTATKEHTISRQQTKYKPSSRNPARKSVHRSRHFNPSHENKTKSEIRLLEPYVLSARLTKLCETGQIDEAVSMLKNAPLDAQNTPVWNTLIWECMKAKRFRVAYRLFIDVCVVTAAVKNFTW
jgi:hypothetical protein